MICNPDRSGAAPEDVADTANVYDTVWSGKDVSVTIGSDIDAGDGSYLIPTETYNWTVLAVTSQNEGCNTQVPDTCNLLEDYGAGWSGNDSIVRPLVLK